MTHCVVVLVDLSAVSEWCKRFDGESDRAQNLLLWYVLKMVLRIQARNDVKGNSSVRFGFRFYDGRESVGMTPREFDRAFGLASHSHTKYFEEFSGATFDRFRREVHSTLCSFDTKLSTDIAPPNKHNKSRTQYEVLQNAIQEAENEFNWQDFGEGLQSFVSRNKVIVLSKCPAINELRSFIGDEAKQTSNQSLSDTFRNCLNILAKPSVKFQQAQLNSPQLIWLDTASMTTTKQFCNKQLSSMFSRSKFWKLENVETNIAISLVFPEFQQQNSIAIGSSMCQTVRLQITNKANDNRTYSCYTDVYWMDNASIANGTPNERSVENVSNRTRRGKSRGSTKPKGETNLTKVQSKSVLPKQQRNKKLISSQIPVLTINGYSKHSDIPLVVLSSVVGSISTSSANVNAAADFAFQQLLSYLNNNTTCATVTWSIQDPKSTASELSTIVSGYVVPISATVGIVVADNTQFGIHQSSGLVLHEADTELRDLQLQDTMLDSLPMCQWEVGAETYRTQRQQSNVRSPMAYPSRSNASTPTTGSALRSKRVECFLMSKRLAEGLIQEAQQNSIKRRMAPGYFEPELCRTLTVSKQLQDDIQLFFPAQDYQVNDSIKDTHHNSQSRIKHGSYTNTNDKLSKVHSAYENEKERLLQLLKDENKSNMQPEEGKAKSFCLDIDDIVLGTQHKGKVQESNSTTASEVSSTLDRLDETMGELLLDISSGESLNLHHAIADANRTLKALGCELGHRSVLTKPILERLTSKMLDGTRVSAATYSTARIRHRMYQVQILLRLELSRHAVPRKDPPPKRIRQSLFELLQKFSFSISCDLDNQSGIDGQHTFRKFVDTTIVPEYSPELPKTVQSIYLRFFEEKAPSLVANTSSKARYETGKGSIKNSTIKVDALRTSNVGGMKEVVRVPKPSLVLGKKRNIAPVPDHVPETSATRPSKQMRMSNTGAGSALLRGRSLNPKKPATQSSSRRSQVASLQKLSNISVVASNRVSSGPRLVRNERKLLVMNHFTSGFSNVGALFRQVQRKAPPNLVNVANPNSASSEKTVNNSETRIQQSSFKSTTTAPVMSPQRDFGSLGSPKLFRSPQVSNQIVIQETPSATARSREVTVVLPTPNTQQRKQPSDDSPALFASPMARTTIQPSTMDQDSPMLQFGGASTSRRLELHFEND